MTALNYFLIDYENVKVEGLNGIAGLSEQDEVCIFYSKNADTLTFDLARRLQETKATVVYQKVEVGTKNALDFQLSSYLGYLVCKREKQRDGHFFVVTKDNGFNALLSYWQQRKMDVQIVIDCTGRDNKSEKDALTEKTRAVLPDESLVPLVVRMIQQYKTKQGINNALMKELKDAKRAGEIYQAIKPLISNKK